MVVDRSAIKHRFAERTTTKEPSPALKGRVSTSSKLGVLWTPSVELFQVYKTDRLPVILVAELSRGQKKYGGSLRQER
jgi:hypothetical protein